MCLALMEADCCETSPAPWLFCERGGDEREAALADRCSHFTLWCHSARIFPLSATRATPSTQHLTSLPCSAVPPSTSLCLSCTHPPHPSTAVMSLLFLDWFVPLYLLVSVLVLAGFGACLYFLEPGLQDAHKWSSKTVRHHPLVASVNCRDDDSNALI